MATQQGESTGKGKKIALFVGGGCLSLVLVCCLTGSGAYFYRQSSIGSAARAHAETYLGQVQARDWSGAYGSAQYDSIVLRARPEEGRLGRIESYRTCIEDTALADITSFACDDVSVAPMEDDGDVSCTLQTTSRGEVPITMRVNSADRDPYNGFIWFGSRSAFGAHWASDACTQYSGREFYRDPPPDRVRPEP